MSYCWSCYNYSTRVEKKEEVAIIQEHKKPNKLKAKKERNQEKICNFQH
jgi:hypothetical protein